MPDGSPAPSVLTKHDLLRFLRVPEDSGIERQTLVRLRSYGLKQVRINKSPVYFLEDVVQFLRENGKTLDE